MAAKPDWLTFRTQAHPGEVLEALTPLFPFGPLRLSNLDRGRDGFATSCSVLFQGADLARLDYGGESQRGWVRCSLSGVPCGLVADWSEAVGLSELAAAQVRRLDLAVTTYRREVTHERFELAHGAGRFNCGGRTPDMQAITSSNPRAGRTLYVGKRDSDKCCRGYEKGFEVAAKYPGELTHLDGFPVEDVYRVEVELKAKTRPVPWEAVWSADQYFAGAYPFCSDILPDVEPEVLTPARRAAASHDLAGLLAHCRAQYGNALFTALTVMQGDMGAVMARIVGKQHHEGLVAAGALLLTPEDIDS